MEQSIVPSSKELGVVPYDRDPESEFALLTGAADETAAWVELLVVATAVVVVGATVVLELVSIEMTATEVVVGATAAAVVVVPATEVSSATGVSAAVVATFA